MSYLIKGDILIELKNYKEAIQCFDKSISIDPSFESAYLNRQTALDQLKKFDEFYAKET